LRPNLIMMVARTLTEGMGNAVCRGAAAEPHALPSPVVISGPSGCGKSTLLKKLFADFPDSFGFSVSHTTRSPRPGEVDGKDYHFTSQDKIKEGIANDLFLEYAEFSGNIYGTSKNAVVDIRKVGKICILDIELQGVLQVKKLCSDLSPVFIFIKPPSLEVLEERLRNRQTESDASLAKRLYQAHEDTEYISQHDNIFNATIVNDDLERAYDEFKQLLMTNFVGLKTASKS